ncbi:MAG: nuclear transport factor 2 family protein [Brevundimonas sp.]|nr:MAG: nuclear transport factor 2 family protein [Brevundimonas sp.]
MRALLLAALLTVSVPQAAGAQAPATATAEAPLVAETRALMEGYAAAIRAGDHAAVSALYSRDGAWMANGGQTRHVPHAVLARRYEEQWEAPAAFEWRDLSYIPTGPDAITVIGRFVWTSTGEPPFLMSYHGHFVREDGDLRIRIEEETPIPDA